MSLVVPFEEIFKNKNGLLANHHTWQRVEIGAVCTILNGFAFKSSLFNKEMGFPVVRIRDLSRGYSETFYDGEFPSEYIVDDGDLLIGMDGIFRCWKWKGGKAGLNQRVCKIILNEKFIDRKFVLYGLNGYLKAIEEATSSVTVGHLSSLDILRIPFPLPPLNEQRRIVAKLEEILVKVNACQQRLSNIPVILKRFRQAVLAAACSGGLTTDWREENAGPSLGASRHPLPHGECIDLPPLHEVEGRDGGEDLPDGWSWEISGRLFSFVTSGSRGWARYYSNSGPLFIRIGNLDHESTSLDLRNIQRVQPPESAEGKRTRVKPNDILISITADVGMIALVPNDIEEAYINQHIALARPTKDIYPPYLAWYLASTEGGLKQFQELQRGATKVGLGLDDIKSIFVPIPSYPEQLEIIRRVEALFTLADQLETRYLNAKEHVDKLTQSILSKAFRGELVPQDEKDEPASMLLERIRAQRAESSPSKRSFVPIHQQKQKRSPEPESLSLDAEPPYIYAATIPQRIIAAMKSGKEYTRADITVEAGLSDAEWTWAIRQLKHEGKVRQNGERRGARYLKA